jgi:hypothetical protein
MHVAREHSSSPRQTSLSGSLSRSPRPAHQTRHVGKLIDPESRFPLVLL